MKLCHTGTNEDERKLIQFLDMLRAAHPDMQWMFTHGQCYNLWRIVRTVFPEANCLYSTEEGHVYIEYQGQLYDIRGKHVRGPKDLKPLDHQKRDKPHRWGGRDTRRLQ